VTDGLNRFLKGQYAERDTFGGMIGFMLGGRGEVVGEQLIQSIQDNAHTPGVVDQLPPIQFVQRFSSCHNRRNPYPHIIIHHALLPMAL